MTAAPAPARDLLGAGADLGLRLYAAPIPVVMGCTGHALAMGAILLFCGDVRIGAEGPFKLGMNEVAIGMPVPRSPSSSAGTGSRRATSAPPPTWPASTTRPRPWRPATSTRSSAPDEVEATAIAEAAGRRHACTPDRSGPHPQYAARRHRARPRRRPSPPTSETFLVAEADTRGARRSGRRVLDGVPVPRPR